MTLDLFTDAKLKVGLRGDFSGVTNCPGASDRTGSPDVDVPGADEGPGCTGAGIGIDEGPCTDDAGTEVEGYKLTK